MTFSATKVANNVLERAFDQKVDITPMKLQKILFFMAAEYAKATGAPMLEEEFQVWKYGPVAYSVYDEFRPFARKYITRYAADANGKSYKVIDATLDRVLDRVWPVVKDRSAVDLSRITHTENSAWWKAFQGGKNLYLKNEDLINDRTYEQELGLPVAI